jgi:hypothetical protein
VTVVPELFVKSVICVFSETGTQERPSRRQMRALPYCGFWE